MEATKKRKLSQEDCETVRYLLKYGRTLKEIAEIIHVDPSTVGKIRLANYDLPTYLEQRKAMNRKTKENKAAAEAERARRMRHGLADEDMGNIDNSLMIQTMAKKPGSRWPEMPQSTTWLMGEEPKYMPPAEVPGQMKMDLKDPSPAAQDDTKSMMKFQAAMMDKLLKKLDELIDVLKGGGKDE